MKAKIVGYIFSAATFIASLYCFLNCFKNFSLNSGSVSSVAHANEIEQTVVSDTEDENNYSEETPSGTYGAEEEQEKQGEEDECRHSLLYVPYKSSGCTQYGNISYWVCEICFMIFADESCRYELSEEEISIEPSGHSYEEIVVLPTCTLEGYTKYVCSVCGDEYIDENSYIPPSHDFGESVIISNGDILQIVSICKNCGYTQIETIRKNE